MVGYGWATTVTSDTFINEQLLLPALPAIGGSHGILADGFLEELGLGDPPLGSRCGAFLSFYEFATVSVLDATEIVSKA